jgi:hypothetical protein
LVADGNLDTAERLALRRDIHVAIPKGAAITINQARR